jgi:CTP:molybdopterin cytidylyltransferase MocA
MRVWQAVAMTTGVCAVLLAAGAGRRFAGPGHKLRASLDGSSVFARALETVLASAIGPVIVVVGADDLSDEIGRVVDAMPATTRLPVSVVHNARWAGGMATSLHAGFDAAAALDMNVVIVGLADQPRIEPEAWRRLADCTCELAVATYDGERGHPVRIARRWWSDVPSVGDEGARQLLRKEAEIVCEVACRGTPTDVDTTDDLTRISGRTSPQ